MVVILSAVENLSIEVRYRPNSLYAGGAPIFIISIDQGVLHLGVKQAKHLVEEITKYLLKDDHLIDDAVFPHPI